MLTTIEKQTARLRKSTALLILLHRSGITAELAQRMNADDWTTVARAARVNKPSIQTRRIVLDHMQQLETPLRAAGASR
ncbi:MAG TPA: hypothetical protein VG297_06200 [Bryobacteraceae bacterium]|nr:hypothetical protein [Bryobacteraceae bacterium]